MDDFQNKQDSEEEISDNDFFSSALYTNRRRRSSAETGTVFSRGTIGGKSVRVPTGTLNMNSLSSDSGTENTTSFTAVPTPSKRQTISTNRVFSPYDLSFFEDPVTTREMTSSEIQRMNAKKTKEQANASSAASQPAEKTSASDSGYSGTIVSPYGTVASSSASRTESNGIGKETKKPVFTVKQNRTGSSKTTSRRPVSSEASPAQEEAKKPAFTVRRNQNASAKKSQRILTPENNVMPEDDVPVFTKRNQSRSSASVTTSQRFLTPENNVMPEEIRPAAKPAGNASSANSVFFSSGTSSSSSQRPAFSQFSEQKNTYSSAQQSEKTSNGFNPSEAVKPSLSSDSTEKGTGFDQALFSSYGFTNLDGEAAASEAVRRTAEMNVARQETPAVIYPDASDSKKNRTKTTIISPASSGSGSFDSSGGLKNSSSAEPDLGSTIAIPISAAAAETATAVTSAKRSPSSGYGKEASASPSNRTAAAKQPLSSSDGGGGKPPRTGGNRKSSSANAEGGLFRILTIILCIGIVVELIAIASGGFIIKSMTDHAPSLNLTDFIGEESTKIYDDSGNLITEVGVYLRENVTYDQYPESLVDAFLSIEDSRFFSHFGFDIPRFTKAMIENLKTMSFDQGGSTFTMQLVKNTYFSIEATDGSAGKERTKSIEYKVQQIYLAMKLEKLLSKKEIFQLYLNKLNFGGNIRGIQRASQYYFGKSCNELTLCESAMLAGIVNLPNRYNPYDYLDYATDRRNNVLYLMNHHGYITDEEYELAKKIKLENTLVGDSRQATEDSEYQSYLDVVLEEALELTGVDPTIKGMQIYTHLNRNMQEQVEAIQNGETSVVFPDDLMQVAMVSMDNHTGAIVAVGGGRNYDGARLLNRATMNYKQPGSSVKPLLSYALAFEYLGYSLDEVLIDKPITYPLESMVLVNASENYQGDVMIRDAVGNSLNIPAIVTLNRVVEKIGKEKVVDYLHAIGFSHVKAENFHLSYAIGGTTFETTCKELAGAHSMLMNNGVYNKPHTIQKVVMTSDGSVIYPDGQNTKVLSPGSAYLAADLEESDVSGPYFNYMQILKSDYPVYAKTGTTDWGNDGVQYGIPKGQMKDKWMVASTSRYTNCVWVGYDMAVAGKETYYTQYKSSLNIPGNINRLLLDKEAELFGTPEGLQPPEDVTESTYIFGTFPHVKPEYAADGGGTVTSRVSKSGLENMPLSTVEEFTAYQQNEAKFLGSSGMSASYDQFGTLNVAWGNSSGVCAGGSRYIGLHDPYNSIDQWGACIADVSWLSGGNGQYWATVYVNENPIAEISSTNGFYTGYVGDLSGEVKVCGGSTTADGSDNTACTVAAFNNNDNPGGYYDEGGNWIPLDTTDYSQYGYWDENGNWIGEGYWDENGFHH